MNIKQELIKYNLLYRAGTPEVSDKIYDDLLDLYKKQVSEEEYDEFREKLFEAPGKVKHPYVMGSLDKTKADEGDDSLVKWIAKNNIKDLFISSKIDGASLRLEYKDGILIDAVTRGDGLAGESIYNKAIHFIPTVLKTHPYSSTFTGHIRGEVVLTKDNFIKLCEMDNEDYKNARTSAVGLINSKEFSVENIKLLKFVAYEIIGVNKTKDEQFHLLDKYGFETAKYTILQNVEVSSIKEKLIELFNITLERCDYDIDGLVLCSTLNDIFENVKIPKNIIAFKANILSKDTTIIDIEWNMSKSGYYKPVAILDPVELGGAMIGRAALYNYQWIKEREIMYGAKVKVLKSGDIIPKIMSINNSNCTKLIENPSICEFCNTVLIEEGVELKCPNIDCSEQLLLKVSQFIRRLGIEDASTKTLRNFNILTFEDLISWRPDNNYKSQEKLYKEITKKVFNIKKEKLFAALDCDGMGEKTVNKLIEHFGFDLIISTNFDHYIRTCLENDNLQLPEGIGEKTIETFLNTLDYNINIYNMFILDNRYNEPDMALNVIEGGGYLTGKSYCFTGKLNTITRSQAEEMVINAGGKISGVSKNLTYLVTNDKDSGSAKNKKAEALGITLIDEEEFLKQVSNNTGDINSL